MTRASAFRQFNAHKTEICPEPAAEPKNYSAIKHLEIAQTLLSRGALEVHGRTPDMHVAHAVTMMNTENYKETKPKKYQKASNILLDIATKNPEAVELREQICDFLVPQTKEQDMTSRMAMARITLFINEKALIARAAIKDRYKKEKEHMDKKQEKLKKKFGKPVIYIYPPMLW
ncbi:MAG TPA: hypothetical protein VGF14_04080 [Alphaproteobacteria bacterium]